MFRKIKQRLAIKSYIMELSLELFSRFGKKHYYTIDQVTQTVQRAGLKTAYLAFAYALFCSRSDFRRYYKPLKVRCTYEGLRAKVSRMYFGDVSDFDAANIIDAVHSLDIKGQFSESGEGFFGVFAH